MRTHDSFDSLLFKARVSFHLRSDRSRQKCYSGVKRNILGTLDTSNFLLIFDFVSTRQCPAKIFVCSATKVSSLQTLAKNNEDLLNVYKYLYFVTSGN